MARKLPKVTLSDFDWLLVGLLAVLVIVTFADDFLLPVVGELLDPVELVLDVIVAYVLGKRTLGRAIAREEGDVVSGKIVEKD